MWKNILRNKMVYLVVVLIYVLGFMLTHVSMSIYFKLTYLDTDEEEQILVSCIWPIMLGVILPLGICLFILKKAYKFVVYLSDGVAELFDE